MKITGIYKITCKANGKIYIGCSNHIFNRWGSHYYEMNRKVVGNKYLYEDFKKYGLTGFTFEILEVCDKGQLLTLEKSYMELLDSKNPEIGYNTR